MSNFGPVDFANAVPCPQRTIEKVCAPKNGARYLNNGVMDAKDITDAIDDGDLAWADICAFDFLVFDFLQQAPWATVAWKDSIATIRANCPGIEIYASIRPDIFWGVNFRTENANDPALQWGNLCPKPTAAMGTLPRDFVVDPATLDGNGDPIPGSGSGVSFPQALVILGNAGYVWNLANKAVFDDGNGGTCITNPSDIYLDSPVVGEFEVSGTFTDLGSEPYLDTFCDYTVKLCDELGLDGIWNEPTKINHGPPSSTSNAPTFNHYLTQTGGTSNAQGPQSQGNPDNTYDLANNLPAWTTAGRPFDDKDYSSCEIIESAFYLAQCYANKGKKAIYGCRSSGVSTWQSAVVWQDYLNNWVAKNGGTSLDAANAFYDKMTATKAIAGGFSCPPANATTPHPNDKDQEWLDNLADCGSGAPIYNEPPRPGLTI